MMKGISIIFVLAIISFSYASPYHSKKTPVAQEAVVVPRPTSAPDAGTPWTTASGKFALITIPVITRDTHRTRMRANKAYTI